MVGIAMARSLVPKAMLHVIDRHGETLSILTVRRSTSECKIKAEACRLKEKEAKREAEELKREKRKLKKHRQKERKNRADELRTEEKLEFNEDRGKEKKSQADSLEEEEYLNLIRERERENKHQVDELEEEEKRSFYEDKESEKKNQVDELKEEEKRLLCEDKEIEKKNQAKSIAEVKCNEDNVNKSEEDARNDNSDTDNDSEEEEDSDCPNMSDNDDSDNADINFSTAVPAFIQSIVNQKDIVKKQQKKHETGRGKESSKNGNHKVDAMVTDDTNGFTSVKKATKQTRIAPVCKTTEGFGNEALRLIREKEFELAVQCLNRGIVLDQSDFRHYINRSYCYLRMGKYAEALNDIKFVSGHFTGIHEMSRIKCREGQALFGLQLYEAAEDAFRESINLAPDFSFAKRELIRTQIMRIVDMGFKERSAILALAKKTTTMGAITLLSEESLLKTTTSHDSCGESPDEDDDNDQDIFYSDTEEDPSNVAVVSKLLKNKSNISAKAYVPEFVSPRKEQNYNYCQVPRTPSQDPSHLRVFKAVPAAKPKKTGQAVNEMAVWVGSITPLIEDEMIIKKFSRFGRVIDVWRSSKTALYAFVYFQSTTAVQKALEEAAFNGGTIDVNGFKLLIKPATHKSKTIK